GGATGPQQHATTPGAIEATPAELMRLAVSARFAIAPSTCSDGASCPPAGDGPDLGDEAVLDAQHVDSAEAQVAPGLVGEAGQAGAGDWRNPRISS
ncbi:hypothetical protein, partial [Nonomuraea ceibae]|uniref:hypothetical protein n=1 Tax=Nonomuraea ceibae TaxID=1935170 RepID=UPI001C5D5A6D